MTLDLARNLTAPATCPRCGGLGLLKTEGGAMPCPCQIEQSIALRIKAAGFPAAFEGATLESYQVTAATRLGHVTASRYVESLIPGKTTIGIMYTGSVGTGKTHLAVAMARRLIETRGVTAKFVDMRELFDRIRSSYEPDNTSSQEKIIKPIVEADVVVIDELGAARPTDWMFETQELILGALYNRSKPIIVTTNLANLPAGYSGDQNGYARAARPETLGDRIGARMWSRLQQMCHEVKVEAPDWRGTHR